MNLEELYLTSPQPDDCNLFLRAVEQSKSLHHPWINPPKTQEEFFQYLERYSQDENISYLIKKNEQIVGVINLNNIIYGAFKNAFLGFYAMKNYAGQGYMTQALKMVVSAAFREHQLHRLEANIQPENSLSINLVQRLNFRKEGISLRYLYIDNSWKDHERWAITAEEWDFT